MCRLINKDRKAHGIRCSVESAGGSAFTRVPPLQASAAAATEIGYSTSIRWSTARLDLTVSLAAQADAILGYTQHALTNVS